MAEKEENIEIQKIYSDEIIQEIQNAFNNPINATVLSSIDELPKVIFADHVKLKFLYDGNRYDTCMEFDNCCVDNKFIKKWKTEPLYAFLYKDWKRLNKGENIFDNNNYIEAKFTVKGNIDIVALLRRVDIDLAEKSFELMEYDDICYNEMHYTIIKAFSPSIQETYSSISKLENENILNKFFDIYGNEIDVDGNNKNAGDLEEYTSVSIEDLSDPESEELF